MSFPVGQGPRSITVDGQGTDVAVKAVLRDRSGNSKESTRSVEKIPYVTAGSTPVYTPPAANMVTGDMVRVPGHDGPVWVVNNRNGGYELRDGSGVLLQGDAGALAHLDFTGTGLLAQENIGAARNLLFLPMEGDHFGAPLRKALLGELIGGAANTIYTRHGDLVDGYVLAGGQFVPLIGRSLFDPITSATVDHGRLYVLSGSSIIAYQAGGQENLELQEIFHTALDGEADGLLVDGDGLTVWQGQSVTFYRILTDGSLIKGKSVDAGGTVHGGIADGELTWLLADGPFADLTWQGYVAGDLVALMRSAPISGCLSGIDCTNVRQRMESSARVRWQR